MKYRYLLFLPLWFYSMSSAAQDVPTSESTKKSVGDSIMEDFDKSIRELVRMSTELGINASGSMASTATVPPKSFTIGAQTWTAENLSVSTFRNGDTIPEAKTPEEWLQAGKEQKPAWCYYNNDPASGAVYGKLYNYYAIADPRGLAPAGWHIPTVEEWMTLFKQYRGESFAAAYLKSEGAWNNETPSSLKKEFAGLPAGFREGGRFTGIGRIAKWATTTRVDKFYSGAYCFTVESEKFPVTKSLYSSDGISVRCVMD